MENREGHVETGPWFILTPRSESWRRPMQSRIIPSMVSKSSQEK